MVPELGPGGEIDHVTFVFAAPVTEAESCQFAPTPIGQGLDIEAAQPELRMLTVTCWWVVFEEEPPPHPASAERLSETITRYNAWE